MAIAKHPLDTVGSSTRSASIFARAGDEPALADLLADPVLHALLASDRLAPLDLEHRLAAVSLAPRRPTRDAPPT